ncbi:MAG: hypothetical protein JST87_16755 [Bacteroidetes bacterium]|nr:hypothetical protein [Bacteroidota bacterium]
MLLGLSSPQWKSDKKKSLKRSQLKAKRKAKKPIRLTLDQQITCFAEIIVDELLSEMDFYGKE